MIQPTSSTGNTIPTLTSSNASGNLPGSSGTLINEDAVNEDLNRVSSRATPLVLDTPNGTNRTPQQTSVEGNDPRSLNFGDTMRSSDSWNRQVGSGPDIPGVVHSVSMVEPTKKLIPMTLRIEELHDWHEKIYKKTKAMYMSVESLSGICSPMQWGLVLSRYPAIDELIKGMANPPPPIAFGPGQNLPWQYAEILHMFLEANSTEEAKTSTNDIVLVDFDASPYGDTRTLVKRIEDVLAPVMPLLNQLYEQQSHEMSTVMRSSHHLGYKLYQKFPSHIQAMLTARYQAKSGIPDAIIKKDFPLEQMVDLISLWQRDAVNSARQLCILPVKQSGLAPANRPSQTETSQARRIYSGKRQPAMTSTRQHLGEKSLGAPNYRKTEKCTFGGKCKYLAEGHCKKFHENFETDLKECRERYNKKETNTFHRVGDNTSSSKGRTDRDDKRNKRVLDGDTNNNRPHKRPKRDDNDVPKVKFTQSSDGDNPVSEYTCYAGHMPLKSCLDSGAGIPCMRATLVHELPSSSLLRYFPDDVQEYRVAGGLLKSAGTAVVRLRSVPLGVKQLNDNIPEERVVSFMLCKDHMDVDVILPVPPDPELTNDMAQRFWNTAGLQLGEYVHMTRLNTLLDEVDLRPPGVELQADTFTNPDLQSQPAREPLKRDDMGLFQGLADEQVDTILKLLNDYLILFSGLGTSRGMKNVEPIHFKMRPGPSVSVGNVGHIRNPEIRAKVRAGLEKWVEQNIIAKCKNPNPKYVSRMTTSVKPDSTIRICIDPKKVHEYMENSDFPLPLVMEAVTKVAHCKFYFSMDLESGFLQLLLDKESQEVTTFNSPMGRYKFIRLPFGFKPASGEFQKTMERALYLVITDHSVSVYIDDIFGGGTTWEEYVAAITATLEALKRVDARIKPSKCKFTADFIDVLGLTVGKGTISPASSRLQGIRDMQPPKNREQLKSYLASLSYWGRNFEANFAQRAARLYQLQASEERFKIRDEHIAEFNDIKEAILKLPLIHVPIQGRALHLYSDSSKLGYGGALFMEDGEKLVPLGYWSRLWSRAESCRSTIVNECAALHWVLKQAKDLIKGSKIVAHIDHRNLIFWTSNQNEMVRRFLYDMYEYNLELQYVQGVDNVVADAMSRVGWIAPTPTVMNVSLTAVQPLSLSPQWLNKIAAAQKDATDKEKRSWALGKQYSEISLNNIVLTAFDDRIVVPRSNKALIQEILQMVHERSGHFGVQQMSEVLKRVGITWVGSYRDLKDRIETCPDCQHARDSAQPNKQGLLMEHLPTSSWNRVVMDYLGPFPTSEDGNSFILVMVDAFTRYCELRPTPSADAVCTAKVLEEIFYRYGPPTILQSDNGSHFKNHSVSNLYAEWGVTPHWTTPHHPSSNGVVERLNAMVLKGLRTETGLAHTDWDKHLHKVQSHINNRINSSIGMSPFQALHGYSPRTIVDALVSGSPETVPGPKVMPEVFSAINEYVLELQENHFDEMKSKHDVGRKQVLFNIGDQVLLFYPSKQHWQQKLHTFWRGPCEVVQRMSEVTYAVRNPVTEATDTFHVDRMRLFNDTRSTKTDELYRLIPEGQKIPCEVLQHRFDNKGDPEFLVRWTGESTQEASWELMATMKPLELIQKYAKKHHLLLSRKRKR